MIFFAIKLNKYARGLKTNILFILLLSGKVLILSSFDKISIFSGHHAVTRSLVSGLRRLNVNFNIDPPIMEVGDVVINLGQENIFWEACKWKRAGRIKKLFCGPNIWSFPEKMLKILEKPELDGFFEPSQWIITDLQYLFPCQKDIFLVWYAGVDEQFWM
ncbi:MAG TPA: hypothetical protein VJ201_00235, partial [Candidatus Babeliales bacterium]|nr:hypothetical protein [Candidatus Babeliales bacterium]